MGKAIKSQIEIDADRIYGTEVLTTPKSQIEIDADRIYSTQQPLSKTERFTAPFVKGVTKALDLPGDAVAGAVNLGLKTPPGMDFELPSGGFTKAAEELGITVPDEQMPDTALSSALEFAGESLPAAGLALKVGKGITQEAIDQAPKIKKFFMSHLKKSSEDASQRPVSYFATETIAGAGAGLGLYVGQKKFPDSPIAQLVTTVTGGFLPQFMPGAVIVRKGTEYTRALTHFLKADSKALRNFSRLQQAADDPKLAADMLGIRKELAKTIPGRKEGTTLADDLDPVDLADDIGLFGVRAAILRKLPQLKKLDKQKVEDINVALHNAFKDLAGDKSVRKNINLTRASLEAHIQVVDDMMSLYVKSATKKADDAVRLIPEGDVLSAERSFFEQLDLAEDASYRIVRGEWKEVPMEEIVSASPVMDIWKKELQQQSRYGANKGRIPSFVTERFGSFVKNKKTKKLEFKKGTFKAEDLTLKDVQDSRSEILQLIREERGITGNKDKNKIRYLNDLQKGLLKILENAGEGLQGEAAFNFKKAIAATKLHSEKFNRGIVAKILGVDTTGLSRVDPDISITSSLSGRPEKMDVNFKQIEAALDKVETRVPEGETAETLFEGPDQGKEYIADWLAAKFTQSNIDGGQVNVQSATKFIQQNERILNRLPDLKKQLENVVATGNTAQFRKTRLKNFKSRIQDPKVSKSAMIIQDDPMKMFSKISGSREPGVEIDGIINQVKKADESGEALEGLQQSFIEFLRRESSIGTTDQHGHKILSGFTLTNILDGVDENEGLKIVFEKLLTSKQQERIYVIADFARSQDLRRNSTAVLDELIGDTANKELEFGAKVLGARMGSLLNKMINKVPFFGGGGGALQVPGYGATRMLDTLRDFTNDPAGDIIVKAILDDDGDLFKALTTKVKSKADADFVTKQLNAWLVTALFEYEEYMGGDSGLDPSKIAETPVHFVD